MSCCGRTSSKQRKGGGCGKDQTRVRYIGPATIRLVVQKVYFGPQTEGAILCVERHLADDPRFEPAPLSSAS